jgi:hypothetical protein
MARTIPMTAGPTTAAEHDRPRWLPWSSFPFQTGCGLSPDLPAHDHSVQANAQILEGFIDALDPASL